MTPPDRTIEIHAPSRLHFGLFSFGNPDCPHQFGGAGMMLRTPGIHLRLTPAAEFSAAGKHAQRAAKFAGRVAESLGWPMPACRLEVLAAPRQHVGLGVGTQLGMTVAAALLAWRGEPVTDAAELATAAGRGERSAIGSHGFLRGGFIVDSGHQPAVRIGSVEARANVPAEWRVVLAIDTQQEGLAQAAERAAFADLPPVAKGTTARLRELAHSGMIPALEGHDYSAFAAALYEYGVLAGGCFAAVQGGPFASRAIEDRVATIRALGCQACGQSSWGPTVFAVTPTESAAEALLDELRQSPQFGSCELMICEPANEGAGIATTDSPQP